MGDGARAGHSGGPTGPNCRGECGSGQGVKLAGEGDEVLLRVGRGVVVSLHPGVGGGWRVVQGRGIISNNNAE